AYLETEGESRSTLAGSFKAMQNRGHCCLSEGFTSDSRSDGFFYKANRVLPVRCFCAGVHLFGWSRRPKQGVAVRVCRRRGHGPPPVVRQLLQAIQRSIFEGLYEWDYLSRPTKLFANTA